MRKVIALHDLHTTDGHTWGKGLDYEVVQKSDHFVLASNEGQINVVNDRYDDVMGDFKERDNQ